MTENPDGSLTVGAGEVVTVVVTKAFAPFAATFSSLIGASWDSSTMSPDGLTETNVFTAPPSVGTQVFATILYDFIPDGSGNYTAGDQYVQTITGSRGGAATPITIVPPPISSQSITFVVG